jgi:hypothetical protein
MNSLFTYLSLLLFVSTSLLQAQTGADSLAGVPAPILPIIKQVEASYTPAQLLRMVQTASPTGWKIVQEKTRLTESGKPQGFSLADFEKLPQKEQQALTATFQPVILEALSKLNQQEQLQLLTMAKDFDPNSIITPVMGLVTKKDLKK